MNSEIPHALNPADVGIWDALRLEWLHLAEASLSRISHCVSQLTDEQVWWRPFPEANSIANQILHVCGNLQQWVIDGINNAGSTRDRAVEFSARGGKSRHELLHELAAVLDRVRQVLHGLSSDSVTSAREIQGFSVTVLGALCHSIPHLVGHTHQIMLMTRLQLHEHYQFQWTPNGDRSSVPL